MSGVSRLKNAVKNKLFKGKPVNAFEARRRANKQKKNVDVKGAIKKAMKNPDHSGSKFSGGSSVRPTASSKKSKIRIGKVKITK